MALALAMALVATALLAPVVPAAPANAGVRTVVDLGDGQRRSPQVWGDTIVWLVWEAGGSSVYTYDIPTKAKARIVHSERSIDSPHIWEDRVVYADYRNNNYDVFMFNLTTGSEKQITSDPAEQYWPVIWGDHIAYSDYRNANYDIYLYDLATSTETQLTTNPSQQMAPAIHGDRVVFEDTRNGNYEIYMYDIATAAETRLTSTGVNEFHPDIYGDVIVWDDVGIPYSNVFMRDLNLPAEQAIYTVQNVQGYPSVFGNKVSFISQEGEFFEVVTYDIDTGKLTDVTASGASHGEPDVYGSTLVWIEGSGATQVYMMFMDRDNDGVGDAEDAFPDNPMGWRDLDGDGHPDLEGVPTDLEAQLASISASAAAASAGVADIEQRMDVLGAALAQLHTSMLAEIDGMNASLAAKVQAEQTALMDQLAAVIRGLDATDAGVAAMNRTLQDLRKLDAIVSDLARVSGKVNATQEKVDDLDSGGGTSMVALQAGLLVIFIVLVLVSIVMGWGRRAPPQLPTTQPPTAQPPVPQPPAPQPPAPQPPAPQQPGTP